MYTWPNSKMPVLYGFLASTVDMPVENVHKWTNAATAAAINLPTVGGAGPSNSSLSCRRTGVRGLAYAGGSLVDRRAVLPGLERTDWRAWGCRARRACCWRVEGNQVEGARWDRSASLEVACRPQKYCFRVFLVSNWIFRFLFM